MGQTAAGNSRSCLAGFRSSESFGTRCNDCPAPGCPRVRVARHSTSKRAAPRTSGIGAPRAPRDFVPTLDLPPASWGAEHRTSAQEILECPHTPVIAAVGRECPTQKRTRQACPARPAVMKFHFDYLCGDAANTCFICLHIYSGSTRRTECLWRHHCLFERFNDADEFDLLNPFATRTSQSMTSHTVPQCATHSRRREP